MEEHELIERFAPTLTKTKAHQLTALVCDAAIPVESLYRLCYYKENEAIAFRAAWVLEHVASRSPERFMPVFHAFIHQLPHQKNRSCQRHFTKILMQITHPKAPKPFREAYAGINREELVDTVFEWLIDPQTSVAVQVNCMDVLFNMCGEFEWIKEELKQQTEFLLRAGSAAMQSRGKKILEKLNKSKTKVDSDA